MFMSRGQRIRDLKLNLDPCIVFILKTDNNLLSHNNFM